MPSHEWYLSVVNSVSKENAEEFTKPEKNNNQITIQVCEDVRE